MGGRLDAIQAPRVISRRQRAANLELRMLKFSPIYNAAAVLRDSWHGSSMRRDACARLLAQVIVQELGRDGCDFEAAVYAVADAICCSPLGTPWEA
jgi:hypothetical protein